MDGILKVLKQCYYHSWSKNLNMTTNKIARWITRSAITLWWLPFECVSLMMDIGKLFLIIWTKTHFLSKLLLMSPFLWKASSLGFVFGLPRPVLVKILLSQFSNDSPPSTSDFSNFPSTDPLICCSMAIKSSCLWHRVEPQLSPYCNNFNTCNKCPE